MGVPQYPQLSYLQQIQNCNTHEQNMGTLVLDKATWRLGAWAIPRMFSSGTWVNHKIL